MAISIIHRMYGFPLNKVQESQEQYLHVKETVTLGLTKGKSGGGGGSVDATVIRFVLKFFNTTFHQHLPFSETHILTHVW